MDTKHTPGPWSWTPQDGSRGHCYIAQVWHKSGDCIAEFAATENPEEASANASISAAAPELLEVLNGFVLNWRHLNDDHFTGPRDKLLALAEAVIAKATGGQP